MIKQNQKRRMELSLGETRRKFPESSFSGVSQDGLIPLARSCNNMFEILPTRDAHWRLPKVFIGGWPHRQLLPASKYQNSRLPEGKQVAGGVTRIGRTFVKWVKLNYISRGSRAHSLEASRHAAQAPRPRCPSAYLNGVSEVHK